MRKSACVVVLGDIGRSPRMQYHCISLAKQGLEVDLIAYGNNVGTKAFESNPLIRKYLMRDVPNFNKYVPKLVGYGLKTIWQTFALLWALQTIHIPSHILVQNPPTIPTLFVVWFYTRFTRSQVVIDWHNYGFTILSLSLGNDHPLVRVCQMFEGFFGTRADHHFCVTKSMRHDLLQRWGIDATVLYDKPAKHFRRGTVNSRHEIISKLKSQYKVLRHPTSESGTIVTEQASGSKVISNRTERPALLISSTSWTEDENFEILLNALNLYEQLCSRVSVMPNLICFITGKGPLKEHYADIIKNQIWRHVHVLLPWLEADDYPTLLAACDLGICLHTSSSKLDLPMKVVDMFGCAVPVCAIKYDCIDELVKHDKNGMIFSSSEELAMQLSDLLKQFPKKSKLEKFARELDNEFKSFRWDENWNEIARPIFTETN